MLILIDEKEHVLGSPSRIDTLIMDNKHLVSYHMVYLKFTCIDLDKIHFRFQEWVNNVMLYKHMHLH
jgi:hypothetical protein